MKYFISVNGQQQGPFEESELLANGITPNTLVWTEGMPEWEPANQIAELQHLFNTASHQQMPITKQPKTWLAESILVTLFCCLPFGIVGIVKASNVSSAFKAGRYAEAEAASKSAKKWTIYGCIIGGIVTLMYIITIIILTYFEQFAKGEF